MSERVWIPKDGILRDVPSTLLPDGALSGGRNIRMRDGKVSAVPGYESVYGTPQVAPLFSMPVIRSASDHFWLYAGANAVYAVDESNTHTDLSDEVYSATETRGWNGGIFGTTPFLNNGIDIPKQWGSVSTLTNLSDLPNWETDIAAGATCQVMRAFGRYLIALNMSEGGTDYPYRTRWSDVGSAGSMPGWDASDTTQDAGFNDLLDSYDEVVDGLTLRDRFIVYKEGEVYIMSLVGGSKVMDVRPLFNSFGLLSRYCVDEYKGFHYCLTPGDVVRHDGNRWESIIDRRNRRWLFSQIDATNFDRSFLVVNKAAEEVWVCFPENGESYATRALVFSLQEGRWGDRDLPGVRHIMSGEIQQGTITWETLSPSTWESWTGAWNDTQYSPVQERLVMSGTADTKIYESDTSNTADGTAIRCSASVESDPFGDTDKVIRVHKVRPLIQASDGITITLRLGAQDKYSDAVSYKEYSYTHGTDKEFNTRVTGKLISWELFSEEDAFWSLERLEFEYTEHGER